MFKTGRSRETERRFVVARRWSKAGNMKCLLMDVGSLRYNEPLLKLNDGDIPPLCEGLNHTELDNLGWWRAYDGKYYYLYFTDDK
jgi:hypothetical protein